MTSKIATEEDFEDLRFLPNHKRPNGIEVVYNEYLDSTRWFDIFKIVWNEDGTHYAYEYQVPATELQEDSEDEFDPSAIYEVEPYEVTVTKYRRMKK